MFLLQIKILVLSWIAWLYIDYYALLNSTLWIIQVRITGTRALLTTYWLIIGIITPYPRACDQKARTPKPSRNFIHTIYIREKLNIAVFWVYFLAPRNPIHRRILYSNATWTGVMLLSHPGSWACTTTLIWFRTVFVLNQILQNYII